MVPAAPEDDDTRAALSVPPDGTAGVPAATAGERGVAIGRDAINPVIVTGDHNQVIDRLIQVGASAGQRDLEIRVRAVSPDGSFPSSAWLPLEDRRVDGIFRPPYSELEARSGVAALEQGLLNDADVKQFGVRLFGALFTGRIKDLYDDCRRGDPGVRFRLIIEDAMLASVPWELLCDPERGEFLARDGTVVRGTGGVAPARASRVRAPVRLLVVDAFPKGLPRMDDQLTAQRLARALRDLTRDRRLDVTILTDVTRRKLRDSLEQAANLRRPRPYQLLHIIGYARREPAASRTVLLLTNEQGTADEVDASGLTELLGSHGLRLVYLSTGRWPPATALEVAEAFGPELLASGVPAVIGQPATVLDDATAEALRTFYAAVVAGRPVDAALVAAQPSSGAQAARREVGPGVPVCYLRPGSGQILDVQPAEEIALSPTSWWPWLRHRTTPSRVVAGIVALVSLVASLLIIRAAVAPDQVSVAPLGPMTGDLNIAVAEFGRRTDDDQVSASVDGKALASDVSDYFHDQVDTIAREIEPGGLPFEIQVRKAPETGLVAGVSHMDRAKVAEQFSDNIRADIVVYGNLDTRAGVTGVVPEFFLSTRRLVDAEELGGHHEFGGRIEAGGNIVDNSVARAELRARLLDRTRAQARFLIGVGYYALTRFDLADAYFNAVESAWPDRAGADAGDRQPGGKEVIYLFLGNTAGKQGKLAEAQAYYNRALGQKTGTPVRCSGPPKSVSTARQQAVGPVVRMPPACAMRSNGTRLQGWPARSPSVRPCRA